MEKLAARPRLAGDVVAESPPPEHVTNFVRRVIRGEKFYSGPERRLHLRYPITMTLRVIPLDAQRTPVGEMFSAITRDISVDGACFYHTEAVKQKLLQLELDGPNQEKLCVKLKVARCRPAGPLYEIGGKFVGD